MLFLAIAFSLILSASCFLASASRQDRKRRYSPAARRRREELNAGDHWVDQPLHTTCHQRRKRKSG
jgi:hypothetical protein